MHDIRTEVIDGVEYGSIVDVIAKLVPDVKRPNKFWLDHKYELLAKKSSFVRRSESVSPETGTTDDNSLPEQDDELWGSIQILKMLSADGKRYKTEVAPAETIMYIAAKIDNRFLKYLVKSKLWETRYMLSNIAQGYSWAADEIHEIIARNCTPADEL